MMFYVDEIIKKKYWWDLLLRLVLLVWIILKWFMFNYEGN